MGAIEFVVVGDPERAKATAVDALNLKGFRLAYMGGALGVAKTNKHKRQLRDELAGIFQQAGVLVGVSEA